MNKKKINIYIAGTVCLYCIMLLLILLKISNTGGMIRMADVNTKNLLTKIHMDITLLLPLVIVLGLHKLICRTDSFKSLNINLKNWKIIIVLILALIMQILMKGVKNPCSYYSLFYYFVVIALPEEIISRGIVYNQLKNIGEERAIILSGIVWGIMHSLLIWVQNGMGWNSIIRTIGLLISYRIINHPIIFLYKKMDNLLIMIMLHAFVDAM